MSGPCPTKPLGYSYLGQACGISGVREWRARVCLWPEGQTLVQQESWGRGCGSGLPVGKQMGSSSGEPLGSSAQPAFEDWGLGGSHCEVIGSHMEGQGRPAFFSQVAKERAATSRGWGCGEPCQQETWLGPAWRSHAPAPRPAGEVGTWESRQMRRNRGSFLP